MISLRQKLIKLGTVTANQDAHLLSKYPERCRYPLLIKAEKGGGGKGMRIVRDSSEFTSALQAAQREAINSFGDGRVLLERYAELLGCG